MRLDRKAQTALGITTLSSDSPKGADLRSKSDRVSFGEKLRRLRRSRHWTLEMLGEKSGLSFSTISKAERGIISLTYDNILKLAFAFDMEMSELLTDPETTDGVSQVVTVERAGQTQVIENQFYVMNMLCSARARKRMMPVLATIKAHSLAEFGKLISHPGEEFVYVLEGELTFQIEGQPACQLGPGDSIYFDSGLGHAYLSSGDTDAELIVVCWHPSSSDIHDAGLQSRMM